MTTATFTFNATQSQDCVNVPIISDSFAESSETFTGNLNTRAPRVTLNPAATIITINEPGNICVCLSLSPPLTKLAIVSSIILATLKI